MQLHIKTGNVTKDYTLTANYAKPYLKVSNSVLPLTTSTKQGLQLKVKIGNQTYRAAEYSSASTSASYKTTSVSPGNMSSTTALTASSYSSTAYLTNVVTTGSEPITAVRTTGSEPITAQSTTGTRYDTTSSYQPNPQNIACKSTWSTQGNTTSMSMTFANANNAVYSTYTDTVAGPPTITYITRRWNNLYPGIVLTGTMSSSPLGYYYGYASSSEDPYGWWCSVAQVYSNTELSTLSTISSSTTIWGKNETYVGSSSYPRFSLISSAENWRTASNQFSWSELAIQSTNWGLCIPVVDWWPDGYAKGQFMYYYKVDNSPITYVTSGKSTYSHSSTGGSERATSSSSTQQGSIGPIGFQFLTTLAAGAGNYTMYSTSNPGASHMNVLSKAEVTKSVTTASYPITQVTTTGTKWLTSVSTTNTRWLTKTQTTGTTGTSVRKTTAYSGISSSSSSTSAWQ